MKVYLHISVWFSISPSPLMQLAGVLVHSYQLAVQSSDHRKSVGHLSTSGWPVINFIRNPQRALSHAILLLYLGCAKRLLSEYLRSKTLE